MVKKLIRKPLGNDKLIINILSLKPQTISIKIVDITTNRVLSHRMIIPRKKRSRFVIDLPYRDYVLGVYVSSLSNDRFRAKVFLKSDKFYMSATGNSPMTSFSQANASGVSGGGNVATTQTSTPIPTPPPPSDTSVVLQSLTNSFPADYTTAEYTNAYGITEFEANVEESIAAGSPFTFNSAFSLTSLPFTGNLEGRANFTINNYYRIAIKNSAGEFVYSNILQYFG
jgi:hypothetical protein